MRRRALIIVLCGLLLGVVAGCGGEETAPAPQTVQGTLPQEKAGDPAAGKKVFSSAGCGACHTLQDAGTKGNVGPNLDDAKPSLELAVERVTNGKAPMPAFSGQLSAEQIKDVAAYVVQATSG